MTDRHLSLSTLARSGLEIYVTDPAHDDDARPRFAVSSTFDFQRADSSRVADMLTEAANSADRDGDARVRDAPTALAKEARAVGARIGE